MILNHCRGCGCPLDPGERYCEECEEIRIAEQEMMAWRMQGATKGMDKERKEGKVNGSSTL